MWGAYSILQMILMGIFLLTQLIFIVGVIPILSRPLISQPIEKTHKGSSETKVAIILPFYNEHYTSLIRTVRSILNQDYNLDLVKVYLVVEKGDKITHKNIPHIHAILRLNGVKSIVIYTKSSSLGKPDALNRALDYVEEDVVIVFDADDVVPPNYISNVVRELETGSYAVTTKVYRIGTRLHSKFLTLDTLIWYDIYLPVYMRLNKYVPLSGEGLAVRTRFLKEIGGFPKTLTEDAHLTLELARRGKKMSYLSDTYIIEHAPVTFKALVNQRIRWFRGYYECIAYLWKHKREFGLIRVLKLGMMYMGPLISIATTISYSIMGMYFLGVLLDIETVSTFINNVISGPMYYLASLLFFGGNLFFVGILIYYFSDTKFEKYTPYIYLAFPYWYILGIIALKALFSPREWYKTERVEQ